MNKEIANTNEILQYIHCGLCLKDFKKEGHGQSPKSFSKLSIGFTPIGLQVWCDRHDCNVAHIDFKGAQHRANTIRKDMNKEVKE